MSWQCPIWSTLGSSWRPGLCTSTRLREFALHSMAEIFAFHECWVSQQDAVATGSTGRMWHEHTVDIRSALNNTVIAVCGCILTFEGELHIHGFIQSTITMPVPQAKLLIRPYTVFYLMMFVKPYYTSECHVQACKMPMACVICDPLYDKSCWY